MSQSFLLIISIASLVTMVITFILLIKEYKELQKLWVSILIISTVVGTVSFGYWTDKHKEDIRENNMNLCEQIGGKYIIVGREKVLVGKIIKIVDIYGCVK